MKGEKMKIYLRTWKSAHLLTNAMWPHRRNENRNQRLCEEIEPVFQIFFFLNFPSSFYSEFFCLVFFTLDFFFSCLKILTLEPVLVLCVIRTIFAIWNRLSRSIWICHTSEITRNIKIHLPLYLLIFHFLDLLVFSY